MAVVISGEEHILAPVQTVWEALNDPDVLIRCIPGCEQLQRREDGGFSAVVSLKIGPIRARFNGDVELQNINPPFTYTIVGEGKGGIAGFAKGRADVTLTEDGFDATVLTYDVTADVGGKIAQIGSRLIQSSSKKIAEEFFLNFRNITTDKMFVDSSQ